MDHSLKFCLVGVDDIAKRNHFLRESLSPPTHVKHDLSACSLSHSGSDDVDELRDLSLQKKNSAALDLLSPLLRELLEICRILSIRSSFNYDRVIT